MGVGTIESTKQIEEQHVVDHRNGGHGGVGIIVQEGRCLVG